MTLLKYDLLAILNIIYIGNAFELDLKRFHSSGKTKN